MKAAVYTQYGNPDVLELKEVNRPTPQNGEVLIKVKAVSINDWDLQLLQGRPFVNRIINGFLRPKIQILGSDTAGVVKKTGSNVKGLKPGDEVFGDLSGRWGGFAEYVCAPESALVLKPSGMSFEQAAAIPQAAVLAIQGLIDKGNIRSGQKVLINGAGGGVGTFGLQIAKQFGVHVTGVDNTGKLDMMLATGFDRVIDYTEEDFTAEKDSYDLVLDTKTNRSPLRYIRALKRRGAYVTVGGGTGRLLQALLLSPLISLFTGKKIRIVGLKPNKDLTYINKLFEAGRLKPVIDGSYRLDEITDAFKLFERGRHKGKVVITMDQ